VDSRGQEGEVDARLDAVAAVLRNRTRHGNAIMQEVSSSALGPQAPSRVTPERTV